jgi:predicted outer membrane repeat protein
VFRAANQTYIEGGFFEMKKKFLGAWILLPVLAVMIAAGGCGGGSGGGESDATFTADSYAELHGLFKELNEQYQATSDDTPVLIELTANLDVSQMDGLAAVTDEDTGATLTISRPTVVFDGKGHTITSRGYPAFHVEGIRSGGSTLGGIEIRNVTVDGAGYQLKMGGGMFFENRAQIALKNCIIKNGSAKMGGGGAFYAGPHGSAFGPEITVEKCVFEGNRTEAGAGGAILGYYAKLSISDSTFDGNSAPLGGAIALYGDGARLTVTGSSSFANNRATHSGGAVHVFYASNRIAGRGTPIRTTTDAEADITAAFADNNTAGISGTGKYVFGVAYDPATYTGEVSPNPTSKLRVNGSPVPATIFADAERTQLAQVIPVSSYKELQEALGYAKFNAPSFDQLPNGHPDPTYGRASDGDIVYLTANLESASENPNAETTDDITGATIYIAKNVAIFGNGHKIDGKGFPVFDIEGGAADGPEVKASIANLTIENGGYSRKLGGAVFVEGNALFGVYNSTFKNNAAARTGAINGGGGAIYLNPHGGGTPKVNVVDSTFTGNKALSGTGGAILASTGEITVSGSTFEGNEAAAGGALGALGTGKLNVGSGNKFIGNKAEYSGGAIAVHYGRSSAGRGISNSKVETTFTGLSTFEGNTASIGNAKKVSYGRFYNADFPTDNSAPLVTFAGTAPNVLDRTILDDLTFSDINRTTLSTGN